VVESQDLETRLLKQYIHDWPEQEGEEKVSDSVQ
jgi:hypothetical protein